MLLQRKAALFCLAFVYTGFFSSLLPPAARLILIAAAALALVAAHLPLPLPDTLRRLAGILLAAFLAGELVFSLYTDLWLGQTIRRYAQQTVSVEAVVQSREYALTYSAGYIVRVRCAGGERASFQALLETPDTSLREGDAISCDASFSEFEEYSGSFPQRRYYFSRGLCLRADADAIQKTGEVSTGLSGAFRKLNASLSAYLQSSLGRDGAALPAALLLGDRSLLPDTLTRDFRRLGVSHLLAISGFHFTVLLGGLERLLRAPIPNKKARTLVLVPVVILYMLLCGMTETAVRSGLMLLLTYAAQFASRESDMPTSLGLSSLLLCLCNPASFYSVGLQLSVSAVVGLGCFSHVLRILLPAHDGKRRRALRQLLSALLLPIAVQLALLPLLCLYFGEVSLLTPVATLLFSPLIQLILILSALFVPASGAAPLAAALRTLGNAVVSLSGTLAAPGGTSVSLAYPFAPLFACALAGCVLITPLLRKKAHILTSLGASAVLIACFAGSIALYNAADNAQCRVVSLSSGKNDALIVQTDGKTLLCDFSDGSYSALSRAYAAAQKRRATELEAVLFTHLHRRHIRSFDKLSDAVYVRALILPAPENDAEADIVRSLRDCAAEKDIPVYSFYSSNGDAVCFGAAELLPGRACLTRSTHPVLTLRLRAFGGKLWYLGASWNESGAAGSPDGSADAVILGAHGPVYKKNFALPFSSVPDSVIVRGESGAFWSEQQSVTEADSLVREGGGEIEFLFCP